MIDRIEGRLKEAQAHLEEEISLFNNRAYARVGYGVDAQLATALAHYELSGLYDREFNNRPRAIEHLKAYIRLERDPKRRRNAGKSGLRARKGRKA